MSPGEGRESEAPRITGVCLIADWAVKALMLALRFGGGSWKRAEV